MDVKQSREALKSGKEWEKCCNYSLKYFSVAIFLLFLRQCLTNVVLAHMELTL